MIKIPNQKGFTPALLLILAAAGIIIYLLVSSTFPFKDKLFGNLYPKPPSHAAGGLTFKTYKSLNFPWGINNKGTSTFRDWLSSKYDETTTNKAFDHINSMGVKTVGMWLWFDRMLIKDANWGTDAYKTQFNPTYKANWESFLKNVVKPKDIELVVTMLTGQSRTERDPYNFEFSTLAPVFTGANILGVGVANGDMTTDVNPKDNFPDNWSVILGNSTNNSYSWENGDGLPGSPAKILKLTSNSTNNIRLNSPRVPYTSQGGLYALSLTYKGALVNVWTNYYDSNGKPLDGDYVVVGDESTNFKGYSNGWTTYTWASRTANIPVGTAQIGITAIADSNAVTYIGPARIALGGRNAKWKNYIQAVKDWVSLYGSNTEYGPAVVSWHCIKEVSDGYMFQVTRDFCRDFYQAVKSTGTTQLVGIDNSPYFKLAVTDPKNQPWFSDAADYYSLHMYRDDGAIPDTSKLDKPFIIGEMGANGKCPVEGVMPCPTPSHLYDTSGDWNLNAVRNFYTNGLSAGAKTVMAWDWNDNGTIAKQEYINNQLTFTFGNAGQWIKDWNPTPTPTPTPSPTHAPSPAPSSTPTSSDKIPPIVSIISPLNGSVVKANSQVNIQASVSDNIKVSYVEFYVHGGSPKCTSTLPVGPYSCIWSVPGKKNTSYTITVKAYDSSKNTSSASVAITAQ